ncbi:MAG: hypothetical protein VXW17_00290 [Pseudomonadota bacterium]|nr:hypothetical protein [Pseudomonadota bacterium]
MRESEIALVDPGSFCRAMACALVRLGIKTEVNRENTDAAVSIFLGQAQALAQPATVAAMEARLVTLVWGSEDVVEAQGSSPTSM